LRVTSACAARLASRARFGDAAVVIEPVLERRAHRRINRRRDFRVVQPVFRLPLKLRILDEGADNAGQPFADIFRRQRDAFR
jgi:hypothetical protein